MRLHRIILVAFLFMLFGTALELYLLEHYEDVQQLIPILCIGFSVGLLFILIFKETKLWEGLFKLMLGLSAISGFYGTFLHLRANFEFEHEMRPTETTWKLFIESLSGALPALAPCSMIVLALLGYSYLLLLKHKK
ncbi:MAG: hypothetical protein ACFB0A_16385 [Croceivirga sp.]